MTGNMSSLHPLSALTADEIVLASSLIRAVHADKTKLLFKGISLHEPPKSEVLKHRIQGQRLPRKAWVNYYVTGTPLFYESIVNLTSSTIESSKQVPTDFHGPCDDEEITRAEKIVLADPRVQAEIEKLQLPKGATVVCDPWIWGADGVDDSVRQYQCYLYMRDPKNSNEPDSNHYAFPLSVCPVLDTVTMTVTRIEYLPTGAGWEIKPPQPVRSSIEPNEYIPELNTLRKDLKPLRVIQPEGASFTVAGDVVRWQKWEFRLTFNYREGMVLHEVSYDERPLFYRVSLSDMTVPYADPRPPFHKKQAFDLGDTGAGLTANDLRLGCDCLGSIYYEDGLIADEQGRPKWKRNAICIHEQDAGLLWKHTNYRTNRAVVVRNRELVLQSIITVSNYEYILAFILNQAGELTYEVRATGILSTQPIDQGVSVPWGTVVHDGVLAVYHQHILSLRIDPELDGDVNNRLVYEEAHAIPHDPKLNPHGNAYTTSKSVVQVSGGYDLDPKKNRVFMIENARKQNPVNGKNVAYKIQVPPFQPLLASSESFHYKRADFADHAIYVSKHPSAILPATTTNSAAGDGHELFAGGQYTNQNRLTTGVRKWAGRKDDITDTDIVVWVQFGLQHIPRIEDFPVMPAETIRVSLKPVNFFTKNPAIDVPPSTQEFNQSVKLGTACEAHMARQTTNRSQL